MKNKIFILSAAIIFVLTGCGNVSGGQNAPAASAVPQASGQSQTTNQESANTTTETENVDEDGYLIVEVTESTIIDVINATTRDTKLVVVGDFGLRFVYIREAMNSTNCNFKFDFSNATVTQQLDFENTRLTAIVLPRNINRLALTCLAYTNISSIVIPDNISSIGTKAFRGCTSLTSIVIENANITIEDDSFIGCSNVTSLTTPVMNFISNMGAVNLSSLTLNAVPRMFTGLKGNTKIQSVVIPEGVEQIGAEAFEDSVVETITVPSTLTYIGARAFKNSQCTSLVNNIFTDTIWGNYYYRQLYHDNVGYRGLSNSEMLEIMKNSRFYEDAFIKVE
ncbi:leucine-rich repeat domain-containing protein [Treponema sp.]|uniref:leucine-rich repeat domain-containing protein n=1 Tax=Treponema sp. TaxID=166 RepID=UPI00298DFF53|nr:leucine-rich repeat domain-containing protein [Treponema sp.]MCR5614503.1 leucine-rich repeat domain-containing protein [Treponema sp.]